MSDELYQIIGRKQTELEVMHKEYDTLLRIVDSMTRGELPLDCVRADLAARCCRVKQEPENDGDSSE